MLSAVPTATLSPDLDFTEDEDTMNAFGDVEGDFEDDTEEGDPDSFTNEMDDEEVADE